MEISLDLLLEDAFMLGEFVTLAIKTKAIEAEEVNTLPDKVQKYYFYVDSDQLKTMRAFKFTDDSVGEAYWVDIDGDIVVYVNDTIYGSPFNKRDGIWMVCNGESVRFELEQIDKQ